MKQLQLCAIQRVNSLSYINKVFDCYERGQCFAVVDSVQDLEIPGASISGTIVPAQGGGWLTRRHPVRTDDNIAQLSLTSGTTGRPKSVLLSHRALGDVSERLVSAMSMNEEVREYLAVPATFSFGLGRVRAIAATGGQIYIPEQGFQLGECAEMLARGEINSLAAVPTMLRLIMSNWQLFSNGSENLRWMEIGSQFMSAEEKLAIRQHFPNAIILQHYGLTEASRSTFLRIDNATIDQIASVGRAIGKTEVKLHDDNRICIRGPHVSDGLLTPEGVTKLTDKDGWLVTNDLGSIESGNLFFEGRLDDQINIGGVKVHAEFLEQKLIAALGNDEFAIAARPDYLRGETVCIFRTPRTKCPAADLKNTATQALKKQGLKVADAVSVMEINEIPRTSTGKIKRNSLRQIAGKESPDKSRKQAATVARPTSNEHEELEGRIRDIWEEALGVSPISRDESFFDLGGDSLSAIGVVVRMEQMGIDKSVSQQMFEGKTIAEIASGQTLSNYPIANLSDAINITRGLFASLVVLVHWLPFFFDRAGIYKELLYQISFPIFRMGTPGFAIVFGIGMGVFHWPIYSASGERYRTRQRQNAVILIACMLGYAVLLLAERHITGSKIGAQWPSILFYSVITFYTLVIITSPMILKTVSLATDKILTALTLAVAAFFISGILRYFFLDQETTGLLELVRLTLVANYGYFEMLGSVLLGLSSGLWLRKNASLPRISNICRSTGALLAATGILISFGTGTAAAWFESNLPPISSLITYWGFVMILLSLAYDFNRWARGKDFWKGISRSLVILGILALGIYIGHGAVIPIKNILEAIGMDYAVSLIIPLTLFATILFWSMNKVYRLFYK